MLCQNNKGVSYWAIIIVLACVVAAMIVAFWPQDEYIQQGLTPKNLWLSARKQAADLNKKAKIEKWIATSGLNEYGDAIDTLYAGGTPLYDEATGERMDRFEYIKMRHPDEPWEE